MKLPPFIANDLAGIHYAIRILIGTSILCFMLQWLGDTNPLWAIISLIIVTEPKIEAAWLTFKARIINTIVGALMGLVFLLLIGQQTWLLPVALTITVLISTYFIRLPLGWRVAPITTAIIMASEMVDQSRFSGMEIALHRTFEVLLGSGLALGVSWMMSLVWAHKETPEE